MCLLLTVLLLTPLLVPPVFSQTNQVFVQRHTYKKSSMPNCNTELNPVFQSLKMVCKPCNCFILGDKTFPTDVNAVNLVCGSGGKSLGGNRYESKNTFRVARCQQKTAGLLPPKCEYQPLAVRNFQTMKIVVICKNKLPVELDSC